MCVCVSLVPRLFGAAPKEPGYEASVVCMYACMYVLFMNVCTCICESAVDSSHVLMRSLNKEYVFSVMVSGVLEASEDLPQHMC